MEDKVYIERIESTPMEQPNHMHTSSESTLSGVQKNQYGYQDTYGESNANQVSIEGSKA